MTPELRKDSRGYFARTFAIDELKKHKIKFNIVHVNVTLTKKKGYLRGMHFQTKPWEEDKIVQCLKGKICDVAVDLRKNSKTFKKWFAIELSETNKKMLLVPKGFAHGFETLTDNCLVQYFMSNYYSASHATGIRWNDPAIGIKWPNKKPKMADKDKNWPLLK